MAFPNGRLGEDSAGPATAPAADRSASSSHRVTDAYGRHVENLRVSVTNRCNLRCVYCHMEGTWNFDHKQEMTPVEIERVVAAAASLGVRKVKVTGGEPTVRGDLPEIIRRVKSHVDEVSMTTNGILLERHARDYRAAGLDRINISMDTVDPENFHRITRFDMVHHVIGGIHAAKAAGLDPIKVNMVVLRELNRSRVREMIDFARSEGITLQLIEFHAPREASSTQLFKDLFYSLDDIEQELEDQSLSVVFNDLHLRKKYTLRDGARVEIVRPMWNPPFCARCFRIRLQADGRLRPCLLSAEGLVDVLGPMRRGASDGEVRGIVERLVRAREPYWTKENLASGGSGPGTVEKGAFH
jgi:cyclic pyranopterin phosphate synthase